MRTFSERCKKYGLRAKPTTLVELPFEHHCTTETKVKVVKKEKNLTGEDDVAVHTSDVESKSVKSATKDEQAAENGVIGTPKADDMAKVQLLVLQLEVHTVVHVMDLMPRNLIVILCLLMLLYLGKRVLMGHHREHLIQLTTLTRYGGTDHGKFTDDLFGHGQWTLPPIRTSSTPVDEFLPKKGIFADSVPGTPADGFLPKKSIFADSVPGTPADGFVPKQSIFADSVPSTPLYGSSYSPQKLGEGPEHGINFSRFDSFRSSDSGFQPQERLSRFDSMRSTGTLTHKRIGRSSIKHLIGLIPCKVTILTMGIGFLHLMIQTLLVLGLSSHHLQVKLLGILMLLV
ncbi:putative pyruvate phosphate dikinase regulatory protein [Bienertia sinuspersici]